MYFHVILLWCCLFDTNPSQHCSMPSTEDIVTFYRRHFIKGYFVVFDLLLVECLQKILDARSLVKLYKPMRATNSKTVLTN
uniref:Putative secreted protein n=1 Tax=Anopheles triannulatus TaxID=58253 RepID=A0A2M4B6B3_9DIPT